MNDPRIVVTEFTAAAWEAQGLQWARALKSLSLTGAVIDQGIPQAEKDRLTELGFYCLPRADTALARYESMGANLPAGRWMCCRPDYKITDDTVAFFDRATTRMVCRSQEQRTFFMVFPIATIENRVKYASLIEKESEKHGGLLTADLFCGPHDQWANFIGLFKYCVESGFLEDRAGGLESLVLNLLAVTFKDSVQVV